MRYLTILLLATNVASAGTILELPPLPTQPPPQPIIIMQPVVTPGTPPVMIPLETGKLVK